MPHYWFRCQGSLRLSPAYQRPIRKPERLLACHPVPQHHHGSSSAMTEPCWPDLFCIASRLASRRPSSGAWMRTQHPGVCLALSELPDDGLVAMSACACAPSQRSPGPTRECRRRRLTTSRLRKRGGPLRRGGSLFGRGVWASFLQNDAPRCDYSPFRRRLLSRKAPSWPARGVRGMVERVFQRPAGTAEWR